LLLRTIGGDFIEPIDQLDVAGPQANLASRSCLPGQTL
jgi:hypothetical protein